MLGAEPEAWIKQAECISRADELATKMGFSFDWTAKAETLSPSGAQKLEILKLLWRDAEIMILDEPTAMLSPADSDALFGSLRQLADQGAAIIVVTHRLPEVLDYCDHVTVLRGGKLMADKPVSETNAEELAELIIGHGVDAPVLDEFEPGEILLKVDSLTVKGERGDEAVQGADLTLRSGEVVGLAGVDGSGQRELFQAILGLLNPVSGSILLCGADAERVSPSKRIEQGLRLIAEDRHAEGVVDDWSLEANASLGLQRLEPLRSGPWIDRKERADFAQQSTDLFAAKHQGIDKPMSSLSGGNQQRFVAARALLLRPKVILAFQPTRGLDIDGAAQVFSQLRKTCRDENAAALVVSFDLDELIEHTDRIVAMSSGRIQSPPPGEEKSRKIIGELMVEAG
jgi:simple sugar transport system ATP-binding protein